jgi:hypothetical protein
MASLSILPAFATMLNASLGAGFLIVPWIFLQIGTPIAVIGILIISFLSIIVSLMLVESSSRAEVLKQMEDSGLTIPNLSISAIFKKPSSQEVPLLNFEEAKTNFKPSITDKRKFEIGQLTRLFLGKECMHVYMIFTFLGILGLFCAYTMMFASSFVSNVPILNLETCDIYKSTVFFDDCRMKYWFWVTAYVLTMATLTYIGIENQQTIQMIFTVARITILSLMFATSIYALVSGNPLNSNLPKKPDPEVTIAMFCFCLPLLRFATGFQNAIPSTIQFLENKERNIHRAIWFASLSLVAVCIMLGTVTGMALSGYDADQLSTLAWRGYNAGIEPRPFWTYILEYSIILFPALNVITSCPPYAVALSEELYAYLSIYFKIGSLRKTIRLLVWIPALVISFFTNRMGKAAAVTGLASYFTVFIGCALIHLVSKRAVPEKSPYEGWHSSDGMAWSIMVCFSLMLLVNSAYLIIN